MVFVPDFIGSKPYTIGVEIELQLLDPKTFNLTPAAPDILAKVPGDMKSRIKQEFIQSMVEVATGICNNISEIESDLKESIAFLEGLCEKSGCTWFSSSLHPFARYQDQLLTPGERYAILMNELQLAGRRLITQGLHVHIGLPDGETAIRVCDTIRPHLPLLLALTASSPYFGGVDTGYASYRSCLLDNLSRSGLPYTFRNWGGFKELVTDLHRAGLINDIRDIWWDVRPHPDFGTVEVRICDLAIRLNEILAIAALVQSLVKTLAEENSHETYPRLEVIANNKWQAARYGINGRFVDLEKNSAPMTIKEASRELVGMVRDNARQLGAESKLEIIDEILSFGTGSIKKRDLFFQYKDHRKVIAILSGEFYN